MTQFCWGKFKQNIGWFLPIIYTSPVDDVVNGDPVAIFQS